VLFPIFTVEVDGKPTAAFNPRGSDDALGICGLPEFRSDLAALTSGGVALCGASSSITVRSATSSETAIFASGARNPSAESAITFVFLIDLDCVVHDQYFAEQRVGRERPLEL